jgi:hypothetical protein
VIKILLDYGADCTSDVENHRSLDIWSHSVLFSVSILYCNTVSGRCILVNSVVWLVQRENYLVLMGISGETYIASQEHLRVDRRTPFVGDIG